MVPTLAAGVHHPHLPPRGVGLPFACPCPDRSRSSGPAPVSTMQQLLAAALPGATADHPGAATRSYSSSSTRSSSSSSTRSYSSSSTRGSSSSSTRGSPPRRRPKAL